MGATILEVRHTTLDHAVAAPMMAQLAEANYLTYGDVTEFRQYPAADFAAPDGALLVLLDDGRPVAGGAFGKWAGLRAVNDAFTALTAVNDAFTALRHLGRSRGSRSGPSL